MSVANVRTIATFASSEGWNEVKPIQIQRFAPPSSVPKIGTSSKKNTVTASTMNDTLRQS